MTPQLLTYRTWRLALWWATVLALKARFFGLDRVPREGGALLVSNHQSFVDPILVTMALYRDGHYMARATLFRNRWFGSLITSLNAFPVQRSTADFGAIKEALRRLKQGHLVVVFPEGTRSPDGRIHPMLPGLGAIAKRARVPVIPTLIDGVFQAWPKERLLPRSGNVIVEYGRPIQPEQYSDLQPAELMDRVRGRLLEMQHCWHSRVPERRLQWYQPSPDGRPGQTEVAVGT